MSIIRGFSYNDLMKKKIAVIGAGFSGLAISWYLLNLPNPPDVTLISNGKEASRISAGILHKYMGLYAKLNPLANEAEKETHLLIKEAEKFSEKSIILSRGLIRLALTEKQRIAYATCAENYSDVQWLENCQSLDPNTTKAPGIFIESGLTIDTESYLDALINACKSKGLKTRIQEITDFPESFDHVVAAMGPHTPSLPLHPLKGQLIEIRWPKNLPPLPYALVSQVYMTKCSESDRITVGATYEHTYENAEPNPQFAIDFLYPKALELYPELAGAEVLNVKAAVRATTQARLPIAKVINPRYSCLAGMGSSGLLFHAYFAKELSQSIYQVLDTSEAAI